MKNKELIELLSKLPDDVDIQYSGYNSPGEITPLYKCKERWRVYEGPLRNYTKEQVKSLPWGEWVESKGLIAIDDRSTAVEYLAYGDPVAYNIGL